MQATAIQLSIRLIVGFISTYIFYVGFTASNVSIPEYGFERFNVFMVVFYLLLSIILWHCLLWDLLTYKSPVRKDFRTLAIKSIDYVWLTTSAVAIVLIVNESNLSHRQRFVDATALKIKQDYVDIERIDRTSLAKYCNLIETKNPPTSIFYINFCKHLVTIQKLSGLQTECTSILDRISYKARDSQPENFIDSVCLTITQPIFDGHVNAIVNNDRLDALKSLPTQKSNKWLLLLILAWGFRTTKTTAEIVDSFAA